MFMNVDILDTNEDSDIISELEISLGENIVFIRNGNAQDHQWMQRRWSPILYSHAKSLLKFVASNIENILFIWVNESLHPGMGF